MIRIFLWLSGWLVAPLSAAAQPRYTGIKENLGALLNDPQDQLVPVFVPSGKQLYFSQNSGAGGRYEIWRSRIENGRAQAKQRAAELNGPAALDHYVFGAHEGRLLINGRFPFPGDSSRFEKGFSWYRPGPGGFRPQQAQALQIEGLDSLLQGRFANIFFHPGKKLLFLGFAAGGGRTDLWICRPLPAQGPLPLRWTRPERLLLNTPADDNCPFLDSRGEWLYFSSNRPGGYGADDIYRARMLDAEGRQWSAPQNLGFYVNSNRSELYYTLSETDSCAYFVSYKNGFGAGDIFRICYTLQAADSSRIPPPLPATPTPQQPPATAPTQTTTPPPAPLPALRPEQLPPERYKPNSLVLVLDVSHSMHFGSKMNLLKKSTDRLLQRLRPIDRVALVTFDADARMPYATDALVSKDTLMRLLQELRVSENETNVNAGLSLAYRRGIDSWIEEGNNEVLVITDGYFTISDRSMELIRKNPQIRLTFVLVDPGSIADNIVRYIGNRFPSARIIRLENENLDVNKLLDAVKEHAARQ